MDLNPTHSGDIHTQNSPFFRCMLIIHSKTSFLTMDKRTDRIWKHAQPKTGIRITLQMLRDCARIVKVVKFLEFVD
jgi:hypothetical protein